MKKRSLSEFLERKRVLQELMEQPGWELLVAVLQTQADQLQQEILFTPCKSVDSALAQEYNKGRLLGLISVSDTLLTEISVAESYINELRSNEDGTDGTAGTAGDFGSADGSTGVP